MRNMLLVLFAVVLILPAFQVEGERHRGGTFPDLCHRIYFGAVYLECEFKGYRGFKPQLDSSCQFTCTGGSKHSLPEGVCENGHVNCNADGMEKLKQWKNQLDERKSRICE
ncbi:uncharacterized protein LOC120850900 [Ixodes scapularis]|uniref:uncharacterized protein LOC120850900 n=1 Tax=Ixodes scapularis TaxID=6945 RepID=UPI001A9DBDE6|nr:uncharacterized protein LOC120850900 [Ixodes scapularis]